MVRNILLVIAAGLLIGLLWAESAGSYGRILMFKTPLSIIFVVTALIQVRVFPPYFRLILVGLILGLVGDVCLALPGQVAFQAGLVAFLLGHIMYVLAFTRLTRIADWINPIILVTVIAGATVLWWLFPHLGKMLVPVVTYIVVISVMVVGAWAAFRNPDVKRTGAWLILIGAVLFYVSDLFVARDRFVNPEFLNRLIGLPLYYGAQFLLALSVGKVK
jgi:uncharacterized membrane protein YhhN